MAKDRLAYNKIVRKYTGTTSKPENKNDLMLAGNVVLLTDTAGQWYVFLDSDLVEILGENSDPEKNWIRILKHAADNGNNITQALAALNISEDEVTAALLRSLESKVIYKTKKKNRITIA